MAKYKDNQVLKMKAFSGVYFDVMILSVDEHETNYLTKDLKTGITFYVPESDLDKMLLDQENQNQEQDIKYDQVSPLRFEIINSLLHSKIFTTLAGLMQAAEKIESFIEKKEEK